MASATCVEYRRIPGLFRCLTSVYSYIRVTVTSILFRILTITPSLFCCCSNGIYSAWSEAVNFQRKISAEEALLLRASHLQISDSPKKILPICKREGETLSLVLWTFLHIYHSNGFWWATTTECLGRKHAHYSCMLPTEKLTILLVGSGGREHAIAWRLAQSERVAHIYVAPGKQPILSRVKMQFLTGRPRQRRYRPWRQSDQCRDWCQRLSQVDRVRHQEQCKIQGAVPLQKK